ncbi:MAG: hypothetical protein DHS20C05_06750 [Hyphococcus sp.]|nr:MAG: hypothetical protein DHS20C05_06750 [Marinicaulis sp.]
MTSDFDPSNKSHLSAADARRAQDFDDLQNELAGAETGRISRFFNESRRDMEAERQRKKNNTIEFLSNLQAMLQDPEYAARYKGTDDLLKRVEAATQRALSKTERELEEILERAARLPDGTIVFKDQDGNARTEEGAIVDVVIADGILWPDDSPSYDDYTGAKQRVDELREYQVDVLGAAQNELEDEDNPPSLERLEEIQQAVEDRAPSEVRSEMKIDAPLTQPKAESSFDTGSPAI